MHHPVGGAPGNPFGGFGGFGPFGRGPRGFGPFGARARRGDIRAGILALLNEKPLNGYQIMQELEQRSGGVWRPSPGSVYPALAQLEDEELVKTEQAGGGRLFSLTTKGKAYVEKNADEVKEPWQSVRDSASDESVDVAMQIRKLMMAVVQVARDGTPQQQEDLKKLLTSTRKAVYRILAEDDADETNDE
ncbi:MAG: PadR family transcriptional regulator [Myxococcaceae bacterium]